MSTPFKIEVSKYIAIIIIAFQLNSCYYDNDDPVVIGNKNIYRGVVVDLDDNPVIGKNVVLTSSFDQPIAEFITDENGRYEGQGVIYNTSLNVGIKNDGNILVELGGQVFTWKNYFTKYTFGYSEYPSGQIVELPPLIYTPISNISIEIINNTGSNYSANYQFEIGVCLKNFKDNVEISSLCYEEKNETLNFDAESVGLIGVFAVTGSTISVTVSNVINTFTQSFTVNEINQEETIVFN